MSIMSRAPTKEWDANYDSIFPKTYKPGGYNYIVVGDKGIRCANCGRLPDEHVRDTNSDRAFCPRV
jgi:hypothetical protein